MIDLSAYTAPYTQVKGLCIDNDTKFQQNASNKQWTYAELIRSITHIQRILQTFIQASGINLNYREWRIVHDANGVEFYIYIDSSVIKVYNACPKQLAVDLLRVA